MGFEKLFEEKVEVKPRISYQKGKNAIATFCHPTIEYDDILVLVDETMSGSAKNGIVITRDWIFTKEDFEEPKSIKIADIQKLELKKGFLGLKLLINGKKFISLTADIDDVSWVLGSYERLMKFIKDREEYEAETDDVVVQENSIFKRLEEDTLIDYLKNSKTFDTAVNVASVAIDLFFHSNFSQKNERDAIRETLSHFFVSTTLKIRKQIEKTNCIGLLNDVATKEFLFYSVGLIVLELRRRGVEEEVALTLCGESLEAFFNNPKTDEFIICMLANIQGIESMENLQILFYLRLFLSNYKERTILPNVDEEMAEVFEDLEEMFCDEETSTSDETTGEFILGAIVGNAINAMGWNIAADMSYVRDARYCVDKLLDME